MSHFCLTEDVEPLDCGYRVVGILLLLLAISEIIADLNMVFWRYPGQTFKFHAKKHPFSCVFWKFVIIKSTIGINKSYLHPYFKICNHEKIYSNK